MEHGKTKSPHKEVKDKMNLHEFVESRYKNHWIDNRFLSAYVRKTERYCQAPDELEPRIVKRLDLVSVEVKDKCKGKGHFTKFLEDFEKEARRLERYIYIEDVQEPRLVTFLEKRGYRIKQYGVGEGDNPSMYYKP